MSVNNILVTGGAGNIASALSEKLAKKSDNQIVIVDNLLTGKYEKIPSHYSNIKFIRCDVNDYNDISSVFFSYKFDYIFHFAAVVGVKRTLEQPLMVLNDIKGIENILKLSKNTGVKKVYYSSSSEVYGEPVELPQNEHTTPLNSRLPYAVVKNLGEAFIRTYHQEYGLEYTIFRFFNTYGPKQSEDFVIPRFVRQALNNTDITIFGDGSQTRTFCYIDDTIDACISAHETNFFINDVINIGGHEEITIVDLAELIINIAKSSSKIIHVSPLKEGDMTRRQPDLAKMNQLLNRPHIPIREGILKLINYFRYEDRVKSS